MAGFIAKVSRDDIAERAIGNFRQAGEDFGKRLGGRRPGPAWLNQHWIACRCGGPDSLVEVIKAIEGVRPAGLFRRARADASGPSSG
ncbi:hypothetical protein [Streptomyces dysideae]|uniref:hypothetical protein n=1 Tax=Streptomyces dysideae TaxID=909626 RepID=UPI000B08078A|nr:hypothetical protein [Streptomyces dysideae]